MVIIWATALTSPRATKTNAMAQVMKVALYGSLVSERPLLKIRFSLPEEKDLSAPSACKVRGAKRMEPSEDDKVEAARPRGIAIPPNTAILLIMSCSFNKSSGLADTDSFHTTRI